MLAVLYIRGELIAYHQYSEDLSRPMASSRVSSSSRALMEVGANVLLERNEPAPTVEHCGTIV